MEDGITIDSRSFGDPVERLLAITTRSAAEEMEAQGRGFMTIMKKITPPAGGKMQNSRGALAQGKRKISNDLQRVFAPVDLKGERTIRQAFGKPLAEPVTVPTYENVPDVAGYFAQKKAGARRPEGFHYVRERVFVDRKKFNRLERVLHKRVGYFAGGFSAAMQTLKVPQPSYVKRHSGTPGTILIKTGPPRFTIIITNKAKFTPSRFREKVEWALLEQTRKIERRLPYMIRDAARQGNF